MVRLAALNTYDAKMHDVLRVELKHLPMGEKVELLGFNGALGFVKYHSQNTYCLFDNANNERSCWGTLAEIAQDADFFMENGCLRPPMGSRW